MKTYSATKFHDETLIHLIKNRTPWILATLSNLMKERFPKIHSALLVGPVEF